MSLPFRPLRAAHTLFVFLPMVAGAQPPTASEYQIEVKSDRPVLGGYVCQLEDYVTRQRLGDVDVRADGVCNFRNVPYGDYRLTITESGNNVVYEDLVSVSQHASSIAVHLPKTELPPGGAVSTAQLLHPPSRKAFAAMLSAQRFSQAGDYRRAAEELQKAVSLSPDYADAHWNLAAQYIRLGDYSRAVDETSRGMELDKPGAMQLCNLAYAQAQLRQFPEAIQSARAALRVDNGYAQAHLVLGTLLAQDRSTLPEAIPHLEQAAKSLPHATQILQLARKDLANQNAQDAR